VTNVIDFWYDLEIAGMLVTFTKEREHVNETLMKKCLITLANFRLMSCFYYCRSLAALVRQQITIKEEPLHSFLELEGLGKEVWQVLTHKNTSTQERDSLGSRLGARSASSPLVDAKGQ